MKLPPKDIKCLQNYFKNQPVLKAYLFGSYSRGEATQDSDIDILVELDYSQKIGLHFVQMALDLEDLLKKKVDLVSTNGLSKYIKHYVEKDKKVIYERDTWR